MTRTFASLLLSSILSSTCVSSWAIAQAQDSPLRQELPPAPATPSYVLRSTEPHDFRIINDGVVALEERLRLIESAQKSIDLEAYIITPEDPGVRLFWQAVVHKARQGVKVRLIIDKTARIPSVIALAHELAKAGIETRVFNTPKTKFLYRDHRKNVLVDRSEVITGGRNLTDEYFFSTTQYMHLDRDIYLRGELVPKIADIYDSFWNDPDSRPLPLDMAKYDRQLASASATLEKRIHALIEPTAEDLQLREKVHTAAASPSNPLAVLATSCRNLTYVSDAPNPERDARFTSNEILGRMSKCEGQLLYETPVFLDSKRTADVLNSLLARGVQITAFTNGLKAANRGTVGLANSSALSWAKKPNFKVYVNMESPLDPIFDHTHQRPDAFTLHAKAMVCGNDSIMIGSYNFDPRSENLNTEMAVFCDNNEALASQLKQAELFWAQNSPELSQDPGAFTRGGRLKQKIALPIVGPIIKNPPLKNQY